MDNPNEIHSQIVDIRYIEFNKSDNIFVERSGKLVSNLISSNYTKLLTYYKNDDKLKKLRLFRFKDYYIVSIDELIISINNSFNVALNDFLKHLESIEDYDYINIQ